MPFSSVGVGAVANDGTGDSLRDAMIKINALIDFINARGIEGENSFPLKPTVRAATTANITLSGAQTIDGVSVVAGERVLVKDQSTGSQNGIYVCAAGAWTRALDFDSWDEIHGAVVVVEEGTTNADRAFVCTNNDGGTLNTTAITFAIMGVASLTSAIWGYLASMSAYMGALLATASASALLSGLVGASAGLNVGQLQGYKNRLINGTFFAFVRNTTSNADDTYCFDRWYALTQTNTIAASRQQDQENGSHFSGRLSQSQATAQRMGLAQIIESINCRDLRGQSVTLSGRVRLSAADDVRYAILEWTGTADAVTSDVVNDWTNGTYTAGQFFNSTTLNVLAVGEVACAANTWRDLTALTATVGASAQNLIVMIWTENAVAQNVTLDLGRIQLEPGTFATPFEHRSAMTEQALCQRYAQPCGYGAGGRATSSTAVVVGSSHNTRMRQPVTVTLNATNPSVRVNGSSSVGATGSALLDSGGGNNGWWARFDGFTGLTAGDTVHVNSNDVIMLTAEL